MRLALSLCCLSLALLLHPALFKSQSHSPFRVIDLRQREIGYNSFDSMAITNREDFETFLRDISQSSYWNDKQAFLDALINAQIDFNREALLLLRHDEGSGSVKVIFETPVLRERTLFCEIRGHLTTAGTADMAYYCFALAVPKSSVNQVQLNRQVGFPQIRRLAPIQLSITERQPLKFTPQLPRKPPPLNCPKVSVVCPTGALELGKVYVLKAQVEGENPDDELIFIWSISAGEIVEGQGTRSLKIRINEQKGAITAALELGGIDPECPRAAICSLKLSTP